MTRSVGTRLDRVDERRFAALVLLPGLVLIALVLAPPVLGVLGLSLFRVELLRDDLRPFVGLHNYLERLPADPDFLATMPRTIVFAAITTIIAVPLALGAALVVNSRTRGGGLLGLLLLLPWAVAPIAAGIFWRLVFDEKFGLVNAALGLVGIAPVPWTSEALPTLVVTAVAVIWRAAPLLALLILGALRAVPPTLARAARLDGATRFQVLRHVTLPTIAPTLVIVVGLQVILSLQVFDILFSVSSGRPRIGGDLTGYAIFDVVINRLSFGYGAALTVVLAIVIAACLGALLLARRWLRRSSATDHGVGDAEDEELPPLPDVPVHVAADELAPGVTGAPGGLPRPRRSSWSGSRPGRALGRIGAGVAVAAVGFWLLAPMAWLAVASLQPEAALRASPPRLTANLVFDGYVRLLTDPAWHRSLIVTVAIAALGTGLALFVAILAAYPLARLRLRVAGLILGLLLCIQLIPPIAIVIPTLMLVIAFGLRNGIFGLVLVNAAFWIPILIWLVRAAFVAVPTNLESAARMDGAGRLGAIVRIVVPAARPGITAAAILVFVGIWNDFIFVAAIADRATRTLPSFLSVTADPGYHVLAAGILLTIAVPVVLITIFHRRIIAAV